MSKQAAYIIYDFPSIILFEKVEIKKFLGMIFFIDIYILQPTNITIDSSNISNLEK